MSHTSTVEKTLPTQREPRALPAAVNHASGSTHRIRLIGYQDPAYFPALFGAYVAGAIVFAIWRTMVVDWNVWFGAIAWFADMFGLITALIFFGILRRSDYPEPRRIDTVNRSVDILIPTANEELSVVEPTVIGARNVVGVRDVLVLDDGDRPEIRAMAKRWGARYVRRDGRSGAKAGNLNNALQFTDAEFLVTLDADHIPMPDLLQNTVGYFDDPRIGFVQTPQSFYNTESITFRSRGGKPAAWHEQEMFYGGVQPAKNRTNSAFYTGTSAVLRRRAIDSIGGFALGSVTEDIHTSIRLHAKGWRSLYLPKPLAYGLEVDNLREFYRTRRRWAVGSLRLLFGSPDSPLRTRGLTLRQRLSYLSSMAAHLQGVHRVVLLATPLAAIATGQSPVRGSYPLFGLISIAFICVSYWVTIQFGRGHFHPVHNEVFALAATLPMLAGLAGALRNDHGFQVSEKRAGRTSGLGVKLAYRALALVCAVGLALAAWRIVRGEQLAISAWSGAFLGLNCLVAGVFLVAEARYARRYDQPGYARLDPAQLYRHVREHARDSEALLPIEKSDDSGALPPVQRSVMTGHSSTRSDRGRGKANCGPR